jgi:hypothetical protein
MLASSRIADLPPTGETVMDTDRRITLAAAAETDPATARFDPETVLPQQFFTQASSAMQSGEKRLMVAILGDAIATYLKYARSSAPKAHGLFAEAADWIESRDQTWPFSFERICEWLDLDPERLRQRLRTQGGSPLPRWHRTPVVTRCRMRTRRAPTALAAARPSS